jgi:hypothetical protein
VSEDNDKGSGLRVTDETVLWWRSNGQKMNSLERSDVCSIAFFLPSSLQPRNSCFLFPGRLFYYRSTAQPGFETFLPRIITVTRTWRVLRCIQPICTHKTSAQSQSVARYQIIRLPRESRQRVGSKAEIDKRCTNGKLALLGTSHEKIDNSYTTIKCGERENRISSIES